ncbi:unnamed protein product [Arctogadus glacialis]
MTSGQAPDFVTEIHVISVYFPREEQMYALFTWKISFTMDEVIIILSEDEDLCCDTALNDSSVLCVEVKENVVQDRPLSAQALEEDLVVTFSKRAEVLPHARYDCPLYPFTRAEYVKSAPIDSNHQFCEQCYCYVCDKLASLCPLWRVNEECHCNSHQRSGTWSRLRNSADLGHLLAFDFSLSDVDSKLQLAERLLGSFRKELQVEFSCFVRGKMLSDNKRLRPHMNGLVHDYTPVYECVTSFLNKAERQEGKIAAIMCLGAAKDFSSHYQPSGIVLSKCPKANAMEAIRILLQRVMISVQRLMVMSDLPSDFIHKLQRFALCLNMPVTVGNTRNSLCVRPWDDVLLVSVLKGQNVTGIRKQRSKKDILAEPISVVLMRSELLQSQCRYRELCRYLCVVIQTDNSTLFKEMRDLVALFMCMEGDFSLALSEVSIAAPRFSPALFRLYLRIFETATAPRVHISPQTPFDLPGAEWGPIQGAVPLRRGELVKFALRVQRCCAAVNADAQCWSDLLTIVNNPRDSPSALPEPGPEFLNDVKTLSLEILNQGVGLWTNIQIPKFFLEVNPDHALLLLVTAALMLRILSGPLNPMLHVIQNFKDNPWVLQWLFQNLSLYDQDSNLIQSIQQELGIIGDQASPVPLEHHSPPRPSTSPVVWDHTYCNPVSVQTVCPKGAVPAMIVPT